MSFLNWKEMNLLRLEMRMKFQINLAKTGSNLPKEIKEANT